jgi:hypothetical protein
VSSPMFSDQPKLTGRTGTCAVCGGEGIPIAARLITEHQEQIVRTGAQANGERRCAGSLQLPEPGTEERPPRHNKMATNRAAAILARDEVT